MRGVSIDTENVLEKLSKAEIVKGYTLIGGTALSLSLGHRLSEDIDLCEGHCSLVEILSEANEYKPHYNTRMILQNIQSLAETKEENIDLLKPIYDIKTSEIEYFFRQLIGMHSRIDKNQIKNIIKVSRIEENTQYHDSQTSIKFTKLGLSL
jgi:hypothetical protein